MNGVNDFLAWDFLRSYAGMVAVVVLVVQFFKFPLDKVWKIPTRYVVWGLSLAILLAVTIIEGNITPEQIVLAICNSFAVAAAAFGTYEVTFKKLEAYWDKYDPLRDDTNP